jgi:hypothetical protein
MSKKIIDITWTASLAYVIGIIASDGSLSLDGRHIDITSKDLQLLETVRGILAIENKIGRKGRGGSQQKNYFRLQFGNVKFYKFLLQIGLTPAKSLTLGKLDIPTEYFMDFFRGCIDGDGNISITNHPESNELQLRIRLTSGSEQFVSWIRETVTKITGIEGGWIHTSPTGIYTLCFGKADSIVLINLMYRYNVPCLERKYLLAQSFIHAGVA